jgi:hypothetical protein
MPLDSWFLRQHTALHGYELPAYRLNSAMFSCIVDKGVTLSRYTREHMSHISTASCLKVGRLDHCYPARDVLLATISTSNTTSSATSSK